MLIHQGKQSHRTTKTNQDAELICQIVYCQYKNYETSLTANRT